MSANSSTMENATSNRLCYCRRRATIRKTRTARNNGRLFYACPLPQCRLLCGRILAFSRCRRRPPCHWSGRAKRDGDRTGDDVNFLGTAGQDGNDNGISQGCIGDDGGANSITSELPQNQQTHRKEGLVEIALIQYPYLEKMAWILGLNASYYIKIGVNMASNDSNVGSRSDNFGSDVVASRSGSGSVSFLIPNENAASL
ncbi:hypothetical protein JHK85_017166 [Glycine max]|nr:hypothetical protein JHK85_017166 [Glycine max]KAG5047383.1 hypothetical protein JHK86_016789 [Glycine max]